MISAVHWVILELAILCIPPCSLFQPPKLTLYTLGGLPPHTHTHNRTQKDIIQNNSNTWLCFSWNFGNQCSGFQALSLSPPKTLPRFTVYSDTQSVIRSSNTTFSLVLSDVTMDQSECVSDVLVNCVSLPGAKVLPMALS